MNRIARCCCGQASIELQGEPKIYAVCHCDNCKTRTGSAFGISAYFRDSQVINKSGNMQVYEIDNDETHQQRYFCAACGTTLYWKIWRFPQIPAVDQLTGVAGGCFVDEPSATPAYSANTDKQCAWLALTDMQTV